MSPKPVVGIAAGAGAGAVAVSAVRGATCARLATGEVKCWGASQNAPGIARSPVALPSAFSGATAFELGREGSRSRVGCANDRPCKSTRYLLYEIALALEPPTVVAQAALIV